MLNSIIEAVDRKKEDTVLKVAHEAVSREKEREYCVWVKPTAKGWEWLQGVKSIRRLDVLMPFPNGRNRARAELAESLTGVLSTKFRSTDGSDEVNSDIDPIQVLAFLHNPDYVAHLFERSTLPAGEEVQKLDGVDWDIDVFRIVQVRPPLSSVADLKTFLEDSSKYGYGEWVKVELNVKSFMIEDVTKHIPFEFEMAIPSRTSDNELQAIVSHYWDVVTAL